MKVLITGAGGFLGQHLVSYLLDKDCKIYNLGNTKIKNSTHFLLDDITNKKLINNAISRIQPDYLLHLAGTADTSDISYCLKVNTLFSSYLLEAIKNSDLETHTKVMIVGSAAEYGLVAEDQLPISENLSPNPSTFYGISKFAQTQIALSWQKPQNPLVVVRPFNIIGPGMPDYLSIGNFLTQIQSISNKGTLRTGNLNTERDFINVHDVTHIMWELINNKNSYGEIINICTGKPIPMIDIVNYILEHSGKEIELIRDEKRIRNNDIKFHYGNNFKLLKLIGNYEFTSWEETLAQTIKNNCVKT